MNVIHKKGLPENENEFTSFANAFTSELQLIKTIAELLRKMGREGVRIFMDSKSTEKT